MSSRDGAVMGVMPPPPGVTPNFENPESIAYRMYIVAIFFPVLALLFLATRLFSATFILRKWHADDGLIFVAFIIAVANSAVCITQTNYGLGNHMWEVTIPDFQMFMKLGMIGGPLTYNLATLFIKLSILRFYLRFAKANRPFQLAVYFAMLVTVGYTVPNALLSLYSCRPMAGYWDMSIVDKQCVNFNAAFHTANTLNMLTDFAILLLPIWMLQPLQLPRLKKIGITLVLMAGGFVCAVSLMRMITAFVGIQNADITWHYIDNLSWCIVEMDFGIICACLPCLKPFVKRYFPNLVFFDPAFEDRVSSFRISDRIARFSRPDHQTDTVVEPAGLRSKPSKSSEEMHEEKTVGEASTSRVS